jgi:hypothetical protein
LALRIVSLFLRLQSLVAERTSRISNGLIGGRMTPPGNDC